MNINGIDIPVYDDPLPHFKWADLKLALPKDIYERLALKNLSSTYPVTGGLLVEDVKAALTKKWK